jgi:hypothetical protein
LSIEAIHSELVNETVEGGGEKLVLSLHLIKPTKFTQARRAIELSLSPPLLLSDLVVDY